MSCIVGVDIGGTFTDIVLLNLETGYYGTHKLLTSSADPSQAVATGVKAVLDAEEMGADEIEYIVHGTTLVANTIIQRNGARTGLLVTAGFEDILEMRNEQRYDVYDLFSTFPEPLVAADLRKPVLERILSDGSVLSPLNQAQLLECLADLAAKEVESVAICFLHSYADPTHEQQAKIIATEKLPDVTVSVSSEIVPHAGEYERLSTTVANAYVQPIIHKYLARLQQHLHLNRYRGRLYMMLSDGGMTSTETAQAVPVRLLESGPAAGIIATCRIGDKTGDGRLVGFDMGGTTAKICIVDQGVPQTTWDVEAGRVDRFKKGSGLPLKIPSVEMVEIGAGGGSIAHVDELGLLKVGPVSAGSTPGPSCYGFGGDRPTVTDALLLLGYLNEDYFLSGQLRLYPDRAYAAIERDVAAPLQLTVSDAALGIYRIACEQMAEAMRVHFAERGKDPRLYTLVAFGGAGPAHACEIARTLHIPRVLVPPAAGIMSATGLLMAPLSFSLLQGYSKSLGHADSPEVTSIFHDLSTEVTRVLLEAGIDEADAQSEWYLDLKYVGQKRSIEVPLRNRAFNEDMLETIITDYEDLYTTFQGRPNRALDIYIEALKVHAFGPARSADWLVSGESTSISRNVHPRSAHFIGHLTPTMCPIYDRSALSPGEVRQGPAIVEEAATTTVIRPGDSFWIDDQGNLVIEMDQAFPKSRP